MKDLTFSEQPQYVEFGPDTQRIEVWPDSDNTDPLTGQKAKAAIELEFFN